MEFKAVEQSAWLQGATDSRFQKEDYFPSSFIMESQNKQQHSVALDVSKEEIKVFCQKLKELTNKLETLMGQIHNADET